MYLFYISTEQGCAIHSARTLESARNNAIRQVGTDYFQSARPATEQDVAWVRGMGGKVPAGKVLKP